MLACVLVTHMQCHGGLEPSVAHALRTGLLHRDEISRYVQTQSARTLHQCPAPPICWQRSPSCVLRADSVCLGVCCVLTAVGVGTLHAAIIHHNRYISCLEVYADVLFRFRFLVASLACTFSALSSFLCLFLPMNRTCFVYFFQAEYPAEVEFHLYNCG